MKRFFCFFVFLIHLNSCTTEFKPATFNTVTIEKSFDADITGTYDNAKGKSELSEAINTSIKNAIIGTLSSIKNKTELNTILKEFNSEYLSFKKDFPGASEPIWELNIETELLYQSQDIITIAISVYEFKGGAHGNEKIKFLNLNAKSGQVLNQNDIVKKMDAFYTLAQKHFVKSLEVEEDNLTMEDFFFGKPFQLPENIGFSDDGLVLLYNAYEIASYNQGYTEFIIPFDDVESYLKIN